MAANAYHQVKSKEGFELGAGFRGIKRFRSFICYEMIVQSGGELHKVDGREYKVKK